MSVINIKNLLILHAEISYFVHRVWFRLLLGKKKRDDYFKEYGIVPEGFIKRGHKLEMNGIKAIPRKETDDFELLFYDREPELKNHLKLHKGETFLDVGANVGYYALKAVTDHGDDVKVIA